MIKSENFSKVMTSELLFKQDSDEEQRKCRKELDRRLKSIGFTDKQVEQFVACEKAVIDCESTDKYNQKLMAKKRFFDRINLCKVEIERLTISELILATEDAANEYPSAKARGYEFFSIVFDFTHSKGRQTAIAKLIEFDLDYDTVKKFIFAELQVIRIAAFNDKGAVDAWGNPEKYLS